MKNYTSTVSPERSIANIEALLIKARAADINKSYMNGAVTAITFRIIEPTTSMSVSIKLPANIPQVFEVLKNIMVKRGYMDNSRKEKIMQQAHRTAWKFMHEWLEIQLSLIEIRQVEMLQIFLPFVIAGENLTFYEKLKQQKFIGLPAPSQEHEEEFVQ